MENEAEEGVLVARAQAGDREAVDRLLERHMPGLEAYVRLKVGRAFAPREDVSDIVQSTCRDLLHGLDGFKHGGSGAFRHWLYATAARKVADKFAHHHTEGRDRAREEAPEAVSRILGLVAGQRPSPSQEAMGAEMMARLDAAFARLREDEREVVLLSRVAGLPRAEVAAAMGRNEGAVRNLLHRTLAKLADELATDESGA